MKFKRLLTFGLSAIIMANSVMPAYAMESDFVIENNTDENAEESNVEDDLLGNVSDEEIPEETVQENESNSENSEFDTSDNTVEQEEETESETITDEESVDEIVPSDENVIIESIIVELEEKNSVVLVDEENSGNYDTSWYDNNPNASEYSLETALELAGLATLVDSGIDFQDVTIRLSEDVDLSEYQWNPIGEYVSVNDNKPFKGIFDGQEHTISGLTVSGNYSGLFAYIADGAVIENLVMNEYEISEGNYTAAAVG